MRKRLWRGLVALGLMAAITPIMATESQAVSYYLIYNDEILSQSFMEEALAVTWPVQYTPTASVGNLYELSESSNFSMTFPISYRADKNYLLYGSELTAGSSNQKWSSTWDLNSTTGASYLKSAALSSNDAKLRVSAQFSNSGGTTYLTMGSNTLSTSDTCSSRLLSGDFTFSAYDSVVIGGTGGSTSKVQYMTMVMTDNTAPAVSSAEGSDNGATIRIGYDEQLYNAGEDSDLKGGLTAYYVNNETGLSGGTISYTFREVSGSYLYFDADELPDVSDYTITQASDIWIQEVTESKNYEVDIYGIKSADGYSDTYNSLTHEYTYDYLSNAPTKLGSVTMASPVMDCAGNVATLGSLGALSMEYTVDRVDPEVDTITMTGSMMTADSYETMENGAWPADIDKSSVYANGGDTLTFTVNTSETITTVTDGTLILNVKHADGSNVVLNYATQYASTDVNGRAYSQLIYETFVAEDGMYIDGDDKWIQPISIGGTYGDSRGNTLDLDAINANLPIPAQQIYLDTKAPTVQVSHLADGDSDDRTHLFMLVISDMDASAEDTILNTSGIIGKTAALSASNSANLSMSYAITDSVETPVDEDYGDTLYQMDLTAETITKYLYVKIDTEEQLNVTTAITVSMDTEDWAGNQSAKETSSSGSFTLDEVVPTASLSTFYLKESSSSVSVFARVYTRDTHIDGGTLWYQWDDGVVTPMALDTEGRLYAEEFLPIQTYTDKVAATYSLTYWVEDAFGNVSEKKVKTFYVDLSMAYGSYTLETPDVITDSPVLKVTSPVSEDENGEISGTGYTRITLIPYRGEYESGGTSSTFYEGVTAYSTTISGGTEVDIFNEDLSWYSFDAQNAFYYYYNNVLPSGMASTSNSYYRGASAVDSLDIAYGEYWVILEHSYENLASNQAVWLTSTAAASYTVESVSGHILYAPPTDDVHGANIYSTSAYSSTIRSAEGLSMLKIALGDTGYYYAKAENTPEGISILLSVDNVLMNYSGTYYLNGVNDWNLMDLDFDQSYVILTQVNDDETYSLGDEITATKKSLATTTTQTYIVPAVDGLDTGLYGVKVVTYPLSGGAPTESTICYIALDNTQATMDFGVTESLVYGPRLSNGTLMTELDSDLEFATEASVTDPLDMIYMGYLSTEDNMGDIYATMSRNTSIQSLEITVMDNDTISLLGEEYGAVEGVAVWNAASLSGDLTYMIPVSHDGYQTIKLSTYEGLVTGGETGNKRMFFTTGELAQIDRSSLYLAPGYNTLCIQVKLDNGNLSEIQYVTVYVSSVAPELTLNASYSQDVGDETGTSMLSADFSIASAFSDMGDTEIYLVTKGYYAINGVTFGQDYNNKSSSTSNNYYNFNAVKLEMDDVVTLWSQTLIAGSTYVTTYSSVQSYASSGGGLDNCTALFMIVDRSGNTTCVVPQFNDDGSVTYSYSYNKAQIVDGNYNYNGGCKYFSAKNIDWSQGTISFTGGDLGDEVVTLSLNNPLMPNAAGYSGYMVSEGYDGYDNTVYINYQQPFGDSEDTIERTVTLNLVGLAGDTTSVTVTPTGFTYITENSDINIYANAYGYDTTGNQFFYDSLTLDSTSFGQLYWEHGTGYTYYTEVPVRINGKLEITAQDAYGETRTFTVSSEDYSSSYGFNLDNITVVLDRPYYTADPVTATITSLGESYWARNESTGYIEQYYYEGQDISGVTAFNDEGTVETEVTLNGSTATVKVAENCTVVVTFEDGTTNDFAIINMKTEPVNPATTWDYATEVWDDTLGSYVVGPDPDAVVGSATAYVVDADTGEALYDSRSGMVASVTFLYDGETTYTFPIGTLKNKYGMVNEETYTIDLTMTITETPTLELEEPDTTAPSVQILAYTVQNGIATEKDLYLRVYDEETQWVNGNLTDYTAAGKTVYTDALWFMEDLGWASSYRFQIQVMDQSGYKVILKDGVSYTEAPSYSDSSDTIEGVSLNGYTLDISANASFTIFVVDKEGNATAVSLEVTQLSVAPVPTYIKTFGDYTATITLVNPDDGTDITVTGVVSTTSSTTSATYEGTAVTVVENGVYTISYTYTYEGTSVTGVVTATVAELDNVPPTYTTTWSANKVYTATNQDVTATLVFDKTMTSLDVAGLVSAPVAEYVELRLTGSVATVKYSSNVSDLALEAVAANGEVINIPATDLMVTNIDKVAPVITYTLGDVADNGKTRPIYFTADETVVNSKINGIFTTGTITASENGETAYIFSDLAGNRTTVTLTVEDLVTEALELYYSEDGVTYTTDVTSLDLYEGDSVYVKANRYAIITMNNANDTTYLDDGSAVVFAVASDDIGLYPVIAATDNYGNATMDYLRKISLSDRVAPVVSLKSYTISVSIDITEAELEIILRDNLNAADGYSTNATAIQDLQCTYSGYTQTLGTHVITYTVTDSAGNASSTVGFLRFYSGSEPEVTIDGTVIDRDATVVLDDPSALVIAIDENAPYSVTYKAGIKTVAQLKIGYTELARNVTGSDTIDLSQLESGYYTFCVQTQDRDYFCFTVKVQ